MLLIISFYILPPTFFIVLSLVGFTKEPNIFFIIILAVKLCMFLLLLFSSKFLCSRIGLFFDCFNIGETFYFHN